MGLIKKYSYLRALIIGVPFGLASLISGIKLFVDLPKFEDLIKEEGTIYTIGSRKVQEGNRNYDFVEIILENGNAYSSGEYKDKILYFFTSNSIKKETVKIWHEKGQNNIRQIVYGETLIIKYTPPYWMAHFFLWLGLITITSALIYVIKHPEDLTGSKKS